MAVIAIDARELRTSTGRYIERLIHYLQAIDTVNHYKILLKPADLDGWHPHNPHFSAVSCPYKEFTFAEQLGFWRQLTALNADLVHFGMSQQPVLYRGKTITTIHDLTTVRFRNPSKNPLIFTIKQFIYGRVVKHAARSSSAVFTPTQFVKDDVIAYTGARPQNITVTLEAADPITDPATPVKGLEKTRFIMYVGRPQPHKNLRRLIDAYSELKVQFPDLKLVLAGKKDALYEQHEAYAKTKGITDIFFTGFVSEGELRWLYENTACYVFPSLSEGFGLPGLEAMLHGAPVASSNATCLPEVYGEAAAYFDPQSTTELSTVVAKIITDSNYMNKLRTLGRERAICFSWKKMAEISFLTYQDVLASTQKFS